MLTHNDTLRRFGDSVREPVALEILFDGPDAPAQPLARWWAQQAARTHPGERGVVLDGGAASAELPRALTGVPALVASGSLGSLCPCCAPAWALRRAIDAERANGVHRIWLTVAGRSHARALAQALHEGGWGEGVRLERIVQARAHGLLVRDIARADWPATLAAGPQTSWPGPARELEADPPPAEGWTRCWGAPAHRAFRRPDVRTLWWELCRAPFIARASLLVRCERAWYEGAYSGRGEPSWEPCDWRFDSRLLVAWRDTAGESKTQAEAQAEAHAWGERLDAAGLDPWRGLAPPSPVGP